MLRGCSDANNRGIQSTSMYRNDEKGHNEAALVDEVARLEDEASALGAEIDGCEQEEREEDARDERFLRKVRIVEIIVAVGLVVVVLAWKVC